MTYTKFQMGITLISVILILSGCQSSPATTSALSKNDGSFSTNAAQSTISMPSEKKVVNYHYEDSFKSGDEGVDFTFHIHEKIEAGDMPIVEVTPHYLTERDAKHVSEVLFGDAEFYESQPKFATIYSKAEIQEKLSRWSQYTSDAAIESLYGSPQMNAARVIKDYIENYTKKMEVAPEAVDAVQCFWKFQESWKYSYTDEQVIAENISISRDDKISASTYLGGIPYTYEVSTRNKSDYKYNTIFTAPNFGLSPWNLDTMILQADLCRGQKPTDEQVAQIKEKAEDLLNRMDLGEWKVDVCRVIQLVNGDVVDYKINVQAVPVFSGITSIRRPQLDDLKNKNLYASNYYLTDAEFYFSPGGNLLYFRLISPVDQVRIVSSSPSVMSMDELMEIAKNHFYLNDAYNYGIGGIMDSSNEIIRCGVDINHLEYGLTRVKIPNIEDGYYYIPSVILQGNVEYIGDETGGVYIDNQNIPLLVLNAVDGSIIPLSNGE